MVSIFRNNRRNLTMFITKTSRMPFFGAIRIIAYTCLFICPPNHVTRLAHIPTNSFIPTFTRSKMFTSFLCLFIPSLVAFFVYDNFYTAI